MPVFLFESRREVGRVRKAGFECDLGHRHGAVLDKEAGVAQAGFKNEAFWRYADMLSEQPGELTWREAGRTRRVVWGNVLTFSALDQDDCSLYAGVTDVTESRGAALIEGAHCLVLGQG